MTLAKFRRLTTAPVGKPAGNAKFNSDNITIKPERGTSRAYTLDRLQRDHPALFEQDRKSVV